MRILSVAGENLASLHGPFTIDFESEPLARAGLFAITGPTGAGKSTILDAICLALYGTTPRLQAVSGRGHVVGNGVDESRLTNTDPASLLRKGTARGFAEVVFVGRDGVRYRARWAVRRARERVDGRIQAPTAELWNEETGEAVGRTRTEVYQAIEARIGLSYDQFCRSVLLAQGEFSRFLLASEKERAELLERVTGTEIYRRISQAAHERLVEARQAVAAVEARLSGIELFSEEERAQREAELQKWEAALRKARQDLAAAEKAVAWFDRRKELGEAVEEAKGKFEAAEAAWKEAEPLRTRVGEADEAEPLREALAAVSRAVGDRKKIRSQIEKAAVAEKEAESEAKVARGEAEAAVQGYEAAVRELEALGPVLLEARKLDQTIAHARSDRERLETAWREASEKVEKQREEIASLEGKIRRHEEMRARAEAWLAEHERLAPLASQWERWRPQLLAVGAAWSARARAEEEAEKHEVSLRDLGERHAAVVEELEALRAAVKEAEEAAQIAAEAVKGIDRASFRARREDLQRAERTVREFERLASELERLREEAARYEKRAARAAEEAAGAKNELGKLEGQAELLTEQLAVAEREFRDAQRALDLKEQRSLLREGEPCPLCGAREHPWAAEDAALATAWKERRERAEGLRDKLAEVQGKRSEVEAQRAAAESRRQEALEAGAERAAAMEALRARWEERAPHLEEALGTLGGEARPAIGDREAIEGILRGIDRAVRALGEEEAEADRLEQAAARAREGARELREKKEAREDAARRLEKGKGELSGLARERRLEAEAAKRQAATLLAPLEALLPEGAAEALARDPQALVEALDGEVLAWREREEARAEAAEALAELRPQRESAAVWLAELQGAERSARAAADEKAARLAALEKERAGLLGGEPADVVERRHRETVKLASSGLEAAREKLAEAERKVASAASLRQSLHQALGEAEEEVARSLEARERALAGAGLSLEEAEARLGHSPEELAAWRRRLGALDSGLAAAKTLLFERERALRAHEEAEPPLAKEAAVRLDRERLESQCKEAETSFHDARAALLADDEARRRAQSILPELEEKRREAKKWAELHELIGSSSGDKFQLFAQSMTLEVLLAHANVHLEDLAPRYRLERVPGQNLQLQVVDRDMGDEVRAANSLSGGETFLVSLALALGLSGLSSNTPVESLFVDEGFGSLDPQSLDMALASLDALQATGRRVGVISHVQGMAERIGVQIRVEPQGSGRSRVQVVGV